jgi:hypothetical protein
VALCDGGEQLSSISFSAEDHPVTRRNALLPDDREKLPGIGAA